MSGSIENKIVIVTGGTGALGRHIVSRLADEGAKVYVPTLSLVEFNEVFDNSQTKDEIEFNMRKIFSFVCDATSEESVVEFVRSVSALENGKIDFLINTVGGIHDKIEVSDFKTAEFNKSMSLNFYSTFFFSREVLKVMQANEFGRIVSIGAIAALETTPGKFAYSVSKSAVVNLMNTISEENKDKNIRANSIVPSIIDTPANREWGSDEEIKKWVNPDEIAGVICNLLSETSSPIRESILKVYGAY